MIHNDSTGSGAILIADAEEASLYATAEYLRKAGFPCDCAPDASVAAQKLHERQYDLLISDVGTPGNCERELIGRLEEIARGVPVILVADCLTIEMARSSSKLPVLAYLFKPIDPNELMAEVRFCLRRSWAFRTIHHGLGMLGNRCVELVRAEKAILDPLIGRSNGPIEAAVGLALENVNQSLDELGQSLDRLGNLVSSLAEDRNGDTLSHAVAACRAAAMERELAETRRGIDHTNGGFRSRQLRGLRRKRQSLAEKIEPGRDLDDSEPDENPGPCHR